MHVLAACLAMIVAPVTHPKFMGRLSARPQAFVTFISRNAGKAIRLDVRFDRETSYPKRTDVFEPYGYKGNPSAPEFDVLDRKYVLLGVPQGKTWQSFLPYDKKTRRLRGLYRISRDRALGGGKRFNLTFLRR